MTIAEELRDRLALKYMGDCKCGHCALVPDELVERAAAESDRLRAALYGVIEIDHRNHGPESRATKIARYALTHEQSGEK